ncbi:hypothetical protein J6590_067091 [Homalodisca vitripennis]|nr:hypothetical protein J6590_067091 [Homalodisca vitripennis]
MFDIHSLFLGVRIRGAEAGVVHFVSDQSVQLQLRLFLFPGCPNLDVIIGKMSAGDLETEEVGVEAPPDKVSTDRCTRGCGHHDFVDDKFVIVTCIEVNHQGTSVEVVS